MRVMVFIGRRLYRIPPPLSSAILPFFLLALGSNFIQPAAGAAEAPAQLFSSRLEAVPAAEFNDVLRTADALWLAGEGLHRLRGAALETVYPEGRYTALELEPGAARVWFAGPEGIGRMEADGAAGPVIPHEAGYIWELVHRPGRLWYFGSRGYGWIDTATPTQGAFRAKVFEPRPFVTVVGDPPARIFIGSNEGLWAIEADDLKLQLSLPDTGSQIVCWIARDGTGFFLGTPDAVYAWNGSAANPPQKIPGNYTDFFRNGINNAVEVNGTVAILDFAHGVALWDKERRRIVGHAGAEGGLRLRDVYKLRPGEPGEVLVLGRDGLATVRLDRDIRFFPASALWGDESFRMAVATDQGAYILSDRNWFRLGRDGFIRGELQRTATWQDVDPAGTPVHGAVNIYEELTPDGRKLHDLKQPVYTLQWGRERGYAVGQDGIFAVSPELELELIHASAARLELLGELGGSLYAREAGGAVLRVTRRGGGWVSERTGLALPGRLRAAARGRGAIHAATSEGLYRLDGDSLEALPLEPGWEVRGLSMTGDRAHALLHNPALGQAALALYGGGLTRMLAVPFLERLGEPLGLAGNATHLGVIGAAGVGWYGLRELTAVAAPEVEIGLLFDGRPLEGRVLPAGTHYIDLQVRWLGPQVPAQVQYRLDGERWRAVNPQDPVLPFAGHGNFTVELRAVHPNGAVSETRTVPFRIAAPWYLNPLYQGALVLLVLALGWGLYRLRHAQLKRTNLWLQEEVRKQTRALEAATAARTQFLAGLSHDIRNPLNGVLMIAETLSRQPPASPDDPRLRELTEYGVIVDRMLGDVLDFSAIDQSRLPATLAPVAVADVIDSAIRQNRFSLQRAAIRLDREVDPALENVFIQSDRNWMIKILANLIINAVDYSGSARVVAGVRCIRLTDTDALLEFRVEDWGKGIDDSEKGLVFEPFYRGESGVESGRHGTGLGLAICRELAHAMGARLTLENNRPSGCRFLLTGRFARARASAVPDPEAVLGSLRGRRVLVVDDLGYNRRAIVGFFRALGCACDEAENGREALALLDANRYHLALLDWDLPGLMGDEVARRHRAAHPDDPVILIALTAYTDGEKKLESEQAGMNGYIAKPLTAARLVHCLAHLQAWQPPADRPPDVADSGELDAEIYKHVDDCLAFGEAREWENLRRCAHRLTTLALIKNNARMQQVCRELQTSAQAGKAEEVRARLAELRQWRRP